VPRPARQVVLVLLAQRGQRRGAAMPCPGGFVKGGRTARTSQHRANNAKNVLHRRQMPGIEKIGADQGYGELAQAKGRPSGAEFGAAQQRLEQILLKARTASPIVSGSGSRQVAGSAANG
jgi:hypothetical protein